LSRTPSFLRLVPAGQADETVCPTLQQKRLRACGAGGFACAAIFSQLLITLIGCGYVGEPLPPSLNIPSRVTDLAARQRGDRILIEFTLPALTTDGVVLEKFGKVDLRAGTAAGAFDAEQWLAKATSIPSEAAEPGPVHVEIPARDWIGKEVILGVRTAGRKGRFSDWSNFAVLPVVPPLGKPAGLRTEATAKGVRLAWSGAWRPGVAFRVWRRAEKQEQPELLGESGQPEYLDTSAEYGKMYQYSVAAILKSGDSEAESEPSGPVEITPVDRFPPAVPAGLTAVAGIQSIELAWEPNTEPDLRGYRVHRASDGQPFQRAADLVETPAYSDRNVEPGQRYRYAVSSLDVTGNESALSPPVEVTAP